VNEENPLNAFIIDSASKNQSGRRKKKLRDIVMLGKGSEVIVSPSTKSSEESMGDGEIKEESNIFRLRRRKRRKKASDRKLIRKNMKASEAFPPLQPAAMSENDQQCHDHRASIVRNEHLEAKAAERRARNKRTWSACKRALGREKEIYKFRDDDDLTRGDE
jgi:hypothetical protein